MKTADRQCAQAKLTSRTCSRHFRRCNRPSRAQTTCSTRSTARFRDGVRFRVVVVFSRGSELDSRTPEKITSSHALRRKSHRKSQVRARAVHRSKRRNCSRDGIVVVRRKRVAVRNFCVYARSRCSMGSCEREASVETHVFFSSSSACDTSAFARVHRFS